MIFSNIFPPSRAGIGNRFMIPRLTDNKPIKLITVIAPWWAACAVIEYIATGPPKSFRLNPWVIMWPIALKTNMMIFHVWVNPNARIAPIEWSFLIFSVIPIWPVFWPFCLTVLGVNLISLVCFACLTFNVVCLPPRSLRSLTRSCQFETWWPSMATIWSPSFKPALAATESFWTVPITFEFVGIWTPPWSIATRPKAIIAKIKLLNGPAKFVTIRFGTLTDWYWTSNGATWISVPSSSVIMASRLTLNRLTWLSSPFS